MPKNSTPQKTLREVLTPPEQDTEGMRWQAAVPLGTNPFLLIELGQFAFLGAAIVLITVCMGVVVTEGNLLPGDIKAALHVSAWVFLGVAAAFAAISFLFFGNRYFALYQFDSNGVYHEGTRGHDERYKGPRLATRAYPVVGAVKAGRTRSKFLPWEKVASFQDLPARRVIILRRGVWNMMRIYTPDADTHEAVVSYLETRLEKS